MLRKIDTCLSSQNPMLLGLTSTFLLISIGVCDYVTGYELSFSIFYLIPVSISAWYLNKSLAIISSICASFAWLLVDFSSGYPYTNQSIPYWNAAVRLGFFLVVALLILRLRQLIELQTSLAQKDSLTGIMNNRAFRYASESIFELAHRNGRPIALGYIDLDGFKGINDSLGHSVGDQVLIAVASTLNKNLRTSDIVARLGGDEFSILLPETSFDGAKTFFTELHFSLLALAAEKNWPIGFSIGVAVFHSPSENLDEAIQYADNLMYKVKRSGKNSIQFAEFKESPK